MTATDLEKEYNEKPIIIDIRKKSEFDSEHVVDAINIPLNEINQHLSEIPKEKPFILHCAGGYRSMIAASILKSRGYNNFKDVEGGMTTILETKIPKTEYVCPTTLL
jgi:rhodanese-related sulfurtransferase